MPISRVSISFFFAAFLLAGALPGCTPSALSDAEPVSIRQVQGTGPRSPMVGAEVVVEGVVTGSFPGRGGLFIQSPPGEEDGDPRASSGLFLTPGSAELPQVGTGRRVRVRGEVVELGGEGPTLTALRVAEFQELAGGDPEPVLPVLIREAPGLPAGPAGPSPTVPEWVDGWERFEGMLVRVEAPLTVTGHSALQRFGEVITSFDGRLFQPTELHPPGPDAEVRAARNAAARLVLDDGSLEQWPSEVAYLPGWPGHDAPFRSGTVLGPVTGIVDVRRGDYLLLPTEPVTERTPLPRPPPPQVEGALRIAVLNVENLFNGDGQGGGFPTPRGAGTWEQYQLQQAKLVATLQALDVQVAALAEVENDGAGPETAIAQFAEALNQAGPARDWRAIEVAEGPGSDAIRVGILYRADRVSPVGSPVYPEDPIFSWGSRPPLGQAFVLDGGDPWLVVANHLKSKGGCPEGDHPRATPGDFDLGDGQACWNAHRVAAARALADWLDADPAGIGGENVLLVGDLNSYGQEDPIRLLNTRGWADAFAASERPYSYVFQGEAGRLDHVLIRASRASRLRGAAIWHSNADEFTGFG
ncbi:MAG: ExeM/NucH family extracellular endonuclease, partial [Gemmatimonadales bacterium]